MTPGSGFLAVPLSMRLPLLSSIFSPLQTHPYAQVSGLIANGLLAANSSDPLDGPGFRSLVRRNGRKHAGGWVNGS